jgi:MFS family permease
MLGSLASGLANGSFWALAPVFAVVSTGDVSLAAWFMTAGVLGGAAGQYPLGWLSDRVDRRQVLLAIALFSALAGMAIWATTMHMSTAVLLASGFVWGCVSFPVYSIAAAHANDRAEPNSYVITSSGLLLMYGVGAICGPLFASFAMTLAGAGALYLYTAVIHALLALFVWYRGLQRAQVKPEMQGDFSEALTSVITATIVPEEGRAVTPDGDNSETPGG